MTIYMFFKKGFSPSIPLPRINPVEINLDVSKDLAIKYSFFFPNKSVIYESVARFQNELWFIIHEIICSH